MVGLVVLGALLALSGLVSIVFPDAAWRLHAWSKRLDGVRAERTDEWDGFRGCQGTVILILGIVLMGYGCSNLAKDRDVSPSPYTPPPFEKLPPDAGQAVEEHVQEPPDKGR